jgi:ferric iron reductase protein FhuF
MAIDPAWTAGRVERLARGGEHGTRPRAVAGAYLGSGLAWVVAVPVAAALVTDRRCPDVTIDNVAVSIDDEGWSTRMAVLAPRFAALPSDPAAGSGDATLVDDVTRLVDATADLLVATFTPVFAAVRQASPYGLSGLWGSLADHVATVLWALRERGSAPAELGRAWALVEQLVDAVQRREPRLRARSRLFRFDRGGTAPPVELPMRGTCCLYYQAPESRVDGGDGLCTTCPRRPDDERIRLVDAHLSAHAAAAGAAAGPAPAAGPGEG